MRALAIMVAAGWLWMVSGCGAAVDAGGPDGGCDGGKCDDPSQYNELNQAAADMVIYEVQARSANACDPAVGASWQRQACADKIAPVVVYRAEGESCAELPALEAVRLGTLDDMLADTADFHAGITLRYIDEAVGANTVWLMPLFPNNDTWDLPAACDNLGSPYAVRDYFHVQGSLSASCALEGRDERSDPPCYGDDALRALIAEAHRRGMRVMLDLAFNHLGHNYEMFDTAGQLPVRARIARGEDLERLWAFAATYDEALLEPELLDSEAALDDLVARDHEARDDLAALDARCPGLAGLARVRAFTMWREALDWERERFPCDEPTLEAALPGFYLGADSWNPSTRVGDNFTSDWRDVKFLFHHATNAAHEHELVRNREYLFRVMNYWTAQGVDAFRLDHTTDSRNGLSPEFWDYVVSKVDYYAWRRGQARPVFLAEEFFDQQGMNRVVDVLTEGYVHDMCARGGVTKDARHVQAVLANMDRFGGHSFVMTALETHDERRLVDGTGFDAWTGAGFWGIGLTTSSTPMLLMGQELGEGYGLAFRKSDYLRSRFEGTAQHRDDAEELVDFYRAMITARLAEENRALRAPGYRFLGTRDTGGAPDPRIFAQVKWSDDANVVFAFHNLWSQDVAQSYYLPGDLGEQLAIRDGTRYRLVDALTGEAQGSCISGADLKWDLYVEMAAWERAQWLRLERCP